MRVVIVDSGGTNIASIQYAFRRLGVQAALSHAADEITCADRVILPGVGAAAAAMQRLHMHGLAEVVQNLRQPVLGICLGMQLLYESSAEGDVNCLGLIPGRVVDLRTSQTEKSCDVIWPHMGWNAMQIEATTDPLFTGIESGAHFYFVHGYAAPVNDYAKAVSMHGTAFTAVCQRDNVIGIQCHPEKPGVVGEQFLANFLGIE